MSRHQSGSILNPGAAPTEIPEFKPIFGKIVVKVDKTPERTFGRIILPQRSADQSTIGTVHAVYEPTETSDGLIESQVKVGDKVLFGQFTGTAVSIGHDIFIICKEHDLLSVLIPAGDSVPDIEEVV
jgi:chaperonin GroES